MNAVTRTLSGFFASAAIVVGGIGVSQNAEARDPTVGEVIVGGIILHQIAKGNIEVGVNVHGSHHGHVNDHRYLGHRRDHHRHYDYRPHWDIRIAPVQPIFQAPQNYVYVMPPTPVLIPQVQIAPQLTYQDFLTGQQSICRQTFNFQAQNGNGYAGVNYDACMANAPQKAVALWNNYVFGRP